METPSSGSSTPENGTHFAPASRATPGVFADQAQAIASSPVVEALLDAVQGLVAVLNEQRQVLALNEHLLIAAGVSDVGEAIGLRLGEMLHCVHVPGSPGGCGTSEFCSTCGAAIAQMSCLQNDEPSEQLCAIESSRNGTTHSLLFRARVSPLRIDGRRFLFVFLQDVTQEQRVAALERTFFHDLNNTALGLSLTSSLLADGGVEASPRAVDDLVHLARRLIREIDLHRCLAQSNVKSFKYQPVTLSVSSVLSDLERCCLRHPSCTGKRIEFQPAPADATLECDATLLQRVLYNMVINALEATLPGGAISVSCHRDGQRLEFSVWNAGVISPAVAKRIFQRNFSTKEALGRGLGTYSMKLLGEQMLGGRVSFTSTLQTGTCFHFSLPMTQRPPTRAPWAAQ